MSQQLDNGVLQLLLQQQTMQQNQMGQMNQIMMMLAQNQQQMLSRSQFPMEPQTPAPSPAIFSPAQSNDWGPPVPVHAPAPMPSPVPRQPPVLPQAPQISSSQLQQTPQVPDVPYTYAVTNISSDSGLMAQIQQIVDKTTNPDELGKGKDVRSTWHNGVDVPCWYKKFEVISVEQIHNPSLKISYPIEKKKIQGFKKPKHLIHFDTTLEPPLTSTLGPIDETLNEGFLWHAASDEALHQIKTFGFEPRHTKRGMFGVGCYLAEDLTKADQYIDPSKGEITVLLVRVCMGNPQITTSEQPGVQMPPGYPRRTQSTLAEKYENRELSTKTQVRRFREFIVFEGRQIYPEFLIRLQRITRNLPASLLTHQIVVFQSPEGGLTIQARLYPDSNLNPQDITVHINGKIHVTKENTKGNVDLSWSNPKVLDGKSTRKEAKFHFGTKDAPHDPKKVDSNTNPAKRATKALMKHDHHRSDLPLSVVLRDQHNTPFADGKPLLFIGDVKMYELARKIDPFWVHIKEQGAVRDDSPYNPLPFSFSYGNQVLSGESSRLLLHALAEACRSPVPFFRLPIALKYTPVPYGETQPKPKPIFRIERTIPITKDQQILKKIDLPGIQEVQTPLDCGRDYFEKLEIIFPEGLEKNRISIIQHNFGGFPYPTLEFNFEKDLTGGECLLQPRFNLVPKPGWGRCGVYTFFPFSSSWVELSTKWDGIACALPSMSALLGTRISIIPKVEIIPQLGERTHGFYIFEQLLKDGAKSIDASDPGHLKINFKLPDIVQSNQGRYAIGYHGTLIEHIESIVIDGLLVPKSVTSVGKVIVIPQDHIRDPTHVSLPDFVKATPDFQNAIFLTPSLHYASLAVYARHFAFLNHYKTQSKTKMYFAVLEVLVEKGKYEVTPPTTQGYKADEGEDQNALEFRIMESNSHTLHIKTLHIIDAEAPAPGKTTITAPVVTMSPAALHVSEHADPSDELGVSMTQHWNHSSYTRIEDPQYTEPTFHWQDKWSACWIAYDTKNKIKVILKQQLVSPDPERVRQIEFLSRMNSAGVPRIQKYFGTKQDFLIMQFIPGKTADLHYAKGITESELINFLLISLETLAGIHAEKCRHRNLTPSHITIHQLSNEPWILDFGLERTKTESIYTPEEAGTSGEGPHSDIYCLGVTALNLSYTHNVGEPLQTKLKNSALTLGMKSIIGKMIDFKYQKRFQSCQEVTKALKDFQAGIIPTYQAPSVQRIPSHSPLSPFASIPLPTPTPFPPGEQTDEKSFHTSMASLFWSMDPDPDVSTSILKKVFNETAWNVEKAIPKLEQCCREKFEARLKAKFPSAPLASDAIGDVMGLFFPNEPRSIQYLELNRERTELRAALKIAEIKATNAPTTEKQQCQQAVSVLIAKLKQNKKNFPPVCSFFRSKGRGAEYKKNQMMYFCETCDNTIGCCGNCIKYCHAGHKTRQGKTASFFCGCESLGSGGTCMLLEPTAEYRIKTYKDLAVYQPEVKHDIQYDRRTPVGEAVNRLKEMFPQIPTSKILQLVEKNQAQLSQEKFELTSNQLLDGLFQ